MGRAEMKCCDINAGMLRYQIDIERKTTAADGIGGSDDTWASIATPYAKVNGLSGGERWQAMRVSPQNRFRAVIRFVGDANDAPFYTGEDRVIYKGRTYSIESVIDVEDSRTWLEIMMVEGKAS